MFYIFDQIHRALLDVKQYNHNFSISNYFVQLNMLFDLLHYSAKTHTTS